MPRIAKMPIEEAETLSGITHRVIHATSPAKVVENC